ncbi:30S ribosomal protein S11 [Candidatus Pacearchaeota archaeon]|nr:30S ribosomal protein S11 [Candidatus Pacearchaeota archaeon]|tara:strand:- start:565 stop:951 length:387 start_codon:yes stop_codon:yes gene_type:complete
MAKNEDNMGILSIHSSFNNTIATLTDLSGTTIGKVSGGQVTKHDRLKANPTIAMFIAKRIGDVARDYKIGSLYIRIRGKTGATGTGPGAYAIVRTLTKEGFKILSMSEVTKIARGGPKKKGGRRGRRV